MPRDRLTPWELASRLSYALWSSMPDDGLFSAASRGALEGEGLAEEVDRMLADDRIDRFVDDFATVAAAPSRRHVSARQEALPDL